MDVVHRLEEERAERRIQAELLAAALADFLRKHQSDISRFTASNGWKLFGELTGIAQRGY